jgi:hypothetical protein
MMFFHSYPETPANTRPIPVEARAAALKKAAPKAKKEEASAVMNSAGDYEVVKGPDGKCRIKIGSYPAGSPIVWLVLENNGSNLLLISEYGLDAKAFDDMSYTYEKTGKFGDSSNEWHNSTLRQWLNDEFLNTAFTPEEQSAILVTDVRNDSSQCYGWTTSGGKDTQDRIFLLSYAEAFKFFHIQFGVKNNVAARIVPTAYASEAGARQDNIALANQINEKVRELTQEYKIR